MPASKPPVDIDRPLEDDGRDHLHPGLQNNEAAPSHGLNAQSGVNAAAPAHPPKAGTPHRRSDERKPVR